MNTPTAKDHRASAKTADCIPHTSTHTHIYPKTGIWPLTCPGSPWVRIWRRNLWRHPCRAAGRPPHPWPFCTDWLWLRLKHRSTSGPAIEEVVVALDLTQPIPHSLSRSLALPLLPLLNSCVWSDLVCGLRVVKHSHTPSAH